MSIVRSPLRVFKKTNIRRFFIRHAGVRAIERHVWLLLRRYLHAFLKNAIQRAAHLTQCRGRKLITGHAMQLYCQNKDVVAKRTFSQVVDPIPQPRQKIQRV